MGLVEDIKSRGYWRVVIRPMSFDEQRVQDLSTLFPIVQSASVQLRGWDFPHTSHRDDPIVGLNWVSQDTRWDHNLETWRIYQSGQFAHMGAFWNDWRDHSKLSPPENDWKPSQRLGIGDTIFRFTEIFEFAARLSSTEVGDDVMHVSVALCNLKDRFLYVDSPHRAPLHWKPTIGIDEFPFQLELARTELLANPRAHALRGARDLFKRFSWASEPNILSGWQAELGER